MYRCVSVVVMVIAARPNKYSILCIPVRIANDRRGKCDGRVFVLCPHSPQFVTMQYVAHMYSRYLRLIFPPVNRLGILKGSPTRPVLQGSRKNSDTFFALYVSRSERFHHWAKVAFVDRPPFIADVKGLTDSLLFRSFAFYKRR